MPSLNSYSQYLVPNRSKSEDFKHGWLTDALRDGESYLKSQRNWSSIDKAVDILSGHGLDKVPKNLSRVHLNMLKRDVKEAVATLANMRPLWGYKTDNSDFANLANILNKMLMSWYLGTFADRSVRQALQYAAGTGLGWVSPVWENDMWVTGRGDIALKVYGPRDVIPFQIGRDHNIQRCYMVTIRDEVPLALAMAAYPLQIDKLSPDRTSPTWMKKGLRRVQKFLSPVLDRFGPGRGKESDESEFPTVDIFRSYIIDLTYNDTDRPISMGDVGTKWHYIVPPYGSEIPTGENTSGGQALYRKAELADSMLYPLRRLIKWTSQGILSDNTAPDWHGKAPVVPFQTDDWPWDFIGTSMTKDGETVQESNTRLMRAIDDSANARLDPALQYDENTMSQGLMERFSPRTPGQRIKTNMQMGDGVKPVLPAAYYDVPSWIPQFIDGLWEKMHYVLGIRDVQALAKAKQMGSDGLEKAMELAGPIITDMSRNMERGMRDLGEMWKADAMQYYDVGRRFQILGKDGVTEEDFDYDPGTMIPSHMPDEIARIKSGQLPQGFVSRANVIERAKIHINSCYFHITPNSLHQITQLTRKMLMIQLFRSGFPIGPWKVAEAMDIDNYGTPDAAAKIMGSDKAPDDEFGRWLLWRELQGKIQGQQQQPGRKPSGQAAPQAASKDGGARGTIKESR